MMIIHGDNRTILKAFPANSIDAIVTDPPYGLSREPNMREVLQHWLKGDDYKHTGSGFMGKSWDSFVPGPVAWGEALRVLKPGGYALVFAGSRTQDLMTTALRLAGFEIRDVIMWLYGSGFPKSLDVSKAVEKAAGHGPARERALKFTAWMRSTGITAGQINAATGSNMASHYLTDKQQPHVATLDQFEAMRHLLPEPPPEIMEIMRWRTIESENMARRKIVETKVHNAGEDRVVTMLSHGGEYHVTEPHTDEAKQWHGYGTALKPAYEPIIVARKPLEGTVADSVLTHGTGAINIGGCRVPFADKADEKASKDKNQHADHGTGPRDNQQTYGAHTADRGNYDAPGRWPANVIHDGLSEEWARYFYCAKISKADREAGCGHLERVSAGEATGGRAEGSAGLDSPRAGAGRTGGARNHHPTVKPTDLMRWLCRLVGHPNAMILDPFAGSGSTGRGAALEGFNFIGIEKEGEYVPIARARFEEAKASYDMGV